MVNYINYFGFTAEPFPAVIDMKKVYVYKELQDLVERFKYTADTGMVSLITGQVGAGKTTSLKYACEQFHPSKYKIIPVIANTGSMLEILRQITLAFNMECSTNSITFLIKNIRERIKEIFSKRQTPILVIDEANLIRERIFQELHNILQYDFESSQIMPLVLAGQVSLIDKLKFHTAQSLASRVAGRSHLEGLDIKGMKNYINHHLSVSGMSDELFNEGAVLAIHQGSGGIMRKANNLARGALVAASARNSKLISAEHVRLAQTELL
jgi:type II secretory pathway predicted ATPase ExeA